MGQPKRILVVDDHPLFREGLKSLLAGRSDYLIAGEAGDGAEALRMVAEIGPDLVIMDISLPDGSGIDVTRTICENGSPPQVVISSMHITIDYVTRALHAGAKGYFVKESATEKLLECLDAVSSGGYYLDSTLSEQVVSRLLGPDKEQTSSVGDGYGTLTSREQEVLRLIAEGLSSKEIADKLRISHKTVENHRTNLMGKLNLHSTMELVRYAARYGIIDLDAWKG